MRAAVVIALGLVAVGCRAKKSTPMEDAGTPAVSDAPLLPLGPWAELASFPTTNPGLVVSVPSRERIPRVSVVGPVTVAGVAVIGGSQLGFVAIEVASGRVVWRRSAGLHVAPPLVVDGNLVLVGDCESAPLVAKDDRVLGCAQVVSPAGDDIIAGPIVGPRAATEAFASARGHEFLRADSRTQLAWSRGNQAVSFDTTDGRATVRAWQPEEVVAHYRGTSFHISVHDDALVGRTDDGTEVFRVQPNRFAAIVGVLPERGVEGPMFRTVRLGGTNGPGMLSIIDVEATGSLNSQSGHPLPGISVLAHAMVADGRTAVALHLDSSLERDYVALFDRSGRLAWTWQLPQILRADPVGLAFTDNSLVVFHDGTKLTMLGAEATP